MHIEILNTGTELLLGSTLNTHGAWIGQQLYAYGLRVARQVTVPDGMAVEQALEECIERSDAVIVTGGLGPTSDDLTRQAVSHVMGIELIEDEHALRSIHAFFQQRGREMSEENRVQALTPCGADVLPNPNGTAPGVYVPPRLGKGAPCAVFLLPGPPNEMHPMFHEEVPHRLVALSGAKPPEGDTQLRFAGVPESQFHDSIDHLLAEIGGLEWGYCARPGELDLRLIGSNEAVAQAKGMALKYFGDACFSDADESLEQLVVNLLAKKKWTLATAESCTGGLIASRVTDVSGASEVFTHGYVTYANAAKEQLVKVSSHSLTQYGAVSEQVAKEMASGAQKESDADIAIAVTGIAGPTGGTAEKPVGTVWLGLALKGQSPRAVHAFYPGQRSIFKQRVSQKALELVWRTLVGAE